MSTGSPSDAVSASSQIDGLFREDTPRPDHSLPLPGSPEQPRSAQQVSPEFVSIPLSDDSVGCGSDGSEAWVLTDSPRPVQQGTGGAQPPSETDDGRKAKGVATTEADATGEAPCEFDDAGVEYVWSSTSSLDWENGPFDYEVPFERPLLHEMYRFEIEYPRAAPVIRALRSLPGQAQRVGTAATAAATTAASTAVQSVQGGEVSTTAREQAGQAARYIIREVGRLGESMTEGVRQTGQELSHAVARQWPVLVVLLGNRWLEQIAELAYEGATSLPGLEQHHRLTRGLTRR
ncbi:hypothetical protein JDV02_005469 [Purpureocillium takamizusanense]|uniref:Uncharacterized protein n=1 Tax=Purpureocillium takamizusanense TaxID=2060973 RepID=A0A9Q8QGN2_9HYPO|nr:uncharacterized protein JDV02_005469 [Purpureocillium takamizusanense]UNI19275.1 hypothetical protein JDV02_005469 [Purpureocillium takamizusanense]